jgi:hypothetical protein
MADVSAKLLGQFVECLQSKVIAPSDGPAESVSNPENPAPAEGPRTIDSAPAEPVDLLGAAGAPVLKRVVPLVAAGVVAYLVIRWLR